MNKENSKSNKSHDLVRTNQKLSVQIKELSAKNEELTETVFQLKKELVKLKKGTNKADESTVFKGITVLYVQVKGTKDIIKEGNAHSLYDELDELFIKFDEIAKKRKIKRLKVAGDNYVCVGGITGKNSTNPVDVALTAIEIKNYLDEFAKKHNKNGGTFWNLRIAIHSGNGIVKGNINKSYTLRGNLIDTLPRIISMCEPGEVIISDYTYELIKGYFSCDYVSELPVKYRGHLSIYKLKRIKRIYSHDRKTGVAPNDDFMLKYLLRQFNDIEEKLLDFLQKKLPKHLHYHDYRHTIDVVNQTELIGIGEGVSDEHILLLKTAALFHDSGHTIQSPNHEEYSCEIARKWLPEYHYSQEQIELICEIIMATQLPPQPKDLLGRIICDADLDYLGRTDFIPGSNLLFEELKAQNVISDLNEWNKLQVKFLSEHQFFTETSNKLRGVNKKSQIDRIQKLIK